MSEQHQYIEDFLPKEEARLNRFEPLGCGTHPTQRKHWYSVTNEHYPVNNQLQRGGIQLRPSNQRHTPADYERPETSLLEKLGETIRYLHRRCVSGETRNDAVRDTDGVESVG